MTDTEGLRAEYGEAAMDGPNTHKMDAPSDITSWTVIPTTRDVPSDDGRRMEPRNEWWHIPTFVVEAIDAAAIRDTGPRPDSGHRYDHDGMHRHHHEYGPTGRAIWWENADQFGGDFTEHTHTGPRPDSGIDVELLAEALDALPPLPYGALNEKVIREVTSLPTAKQWAVFIAAEYARLSTPRTETSE